MSSTGRTIGYAFAIAAAVLLGYLIIAFITGYLNQLRPVCPRGYRALSVDGSKSRLPATEDDFVVPDQDFPICSPILACPVVGLQYAVQHDGSAMQSICDLPNCPCSVYQHCPAYVSTVFRQFGAEERVSYFQVVDPQVRNKNTPPDPFNPPILITPNSNDSCFITEAARQLVWPRLEVGQPCLRGTLAKLSTNTALMACVPTAFIGDDTTPGVFNVQKYLDAYRTGREELIR